MLGSHSASPDLHCLPSNFNAAADIFMECLPKRLRGDQTRFTSAITTAMCGFTVGWELRSPEPCRTPRNTLNFAHLSCPQHAGVGLGSRDESDTVPAHGEPAVCRRGLYTHKLPSSEVAGDQCAETGTRDKLGLGGGQVRGGLFLSSESGLKRKPEIRAFGVLSCCGSPGSFLARRGSPRLPSIPSWSQGVTPPFL